MEIKICGLTNVEDAEVALALGADYLGFVLFARSPRHVTAERLLRLAADLPADARKVGVFVNERPETVREIAAACGLAAVQIHGDEPAADYADFPVPVWRALAVGAGTCRPDPAAWPAARYVLDAPAPDRYGGTGQRADWGRAAAIAAARPSMLAGGLTAENVAAAIEAVRPLGVDVSSGIERSAGCKDRARMAAFIEAVRGQRRGKP